MIGEKTGRVGVGLETGGRYQARVIKIHNQNVFVSLGGPNEGVVPLLQFTDMPTEGQSPVKPSRHPTGAISRKEPS
jgi:small subunit ribosomal protein S1